MPGRNQTGPNGMGPMTGRGMGVRNGNGGTLNSGFGRGNRMGRGNGFGNGMGRGVGYGYGIQQNRVASDVNIAQKTFLENELKVMKDQVATIEKELEAVNKVNVNNSSKEKE